MRIKNEYIKLKTGNKTITLNNYIYDDYLELFSKTQYSNDVDELKMYNQYKRLYDCYIRFDEPVEDIKNVTFNDFQIEIINTPNFNYVGNRNSVSTVYNYNFDELNAWNIETGRPVHINIDDYYGRKITTLAFGQQGIIYACLDVSNYDIYVLENEGLLITRKDVITSEATCYGYEYPLHLNPIGDIKNAIYLDNTIYPKYAKLYSIGLSKTLGTINEEYIIGDDIDIKVKSDTSFGFNLRKGENVSVYPQNNLYTSSDLYPLPLYVKREIYPQNELYTSDDLYPSDSNYKFIFYKFRLYTIIFDDNLGDYVINYLDEYYTMYLENNTKGLFEIVTKIERSDD